MASDLLPVSNVNPTIEQLTEHLRHQKRELEILKAIIQNVSNSANLKDTMESALEIILCEMEASTGWICLMDEKKGCFSFVGYRGICFPEQEVNAKPCLVNCICNRVQTTRQIVVIHQLSEGCPLQEIDSGSSEPVMGHVSVPLTTRSRVVGQLNVAFTTTDQANQLDVELLQAVAPQLAVAVENARLWDEVQGKETLRSKLLKRVVVAQEEERRRISRELHDELGQGLTSLLVRLQVLDNLAAEGRSSVEIIGGLKNSVSQMLTSIHDLALELRPTTLDDLGLVAALEQYAKTCPERLGIHVDFDAIGVDGDRIPRDVEITIYRAVQESLTNVARHAKTNQASILLHKEDKAISVIIEDHGLGFDPLVLQNAHERISRLGLYGMEERVAIVGGKITIESSPGMGTTLYIEIPLKDACSS